MNLKRKIYEKLVNWKRESQGTSSVLIEGARRVGKSYIAKTFGKQEYKSYLLIDFSNISENIDDKELQVLVIIHPLFSL